MHTVGSRTAYCSHESALGIIMTRVRPIDRASEQQQRAYLDCRWMRGVLVQGRAWCCALDDRITIIECCCPDSEGYSIMCSLLTAAWVEDGKEKQWRLSSQQTQHTGSSGSERSAILLEPIGDARVSVVEVYYSALRSCYGCEQAVVQPPESTPSHAATMQPTKSKPSAMSRACGRLAQCLPCDILLLFNSFVNLLNYY